MTDHYQRTTKDSDGGDILQKELPRYDIVCYITREWEIVPRRPHMTALAQFGRVLVVQVPMNIFSPLQKPRKFLKWLMGTDRLTQASETLFLARPWMVVPYGIAFRFPWLRGLNRWFVARHIRGFIKKLDFQAKAALIFDPAQVFLTGLAREELLCYEIVDQYASYIGLSDAQRQQIIREEEDLLRKADIVFVTNSCLYDEKSRLRSHTYVISNTADVELFAQAQAPETSVPPDLEGIPKPRIGFIGNINEIFDYELLTTLSSRHPQWSFVLLGRVNGAKEFRRSPSFRALLAQPNVHHLGWRDYPMLPSYLKGFDACLLPDVYNDLTAYVLHNKLFQYLAAGKPVVSTALPPIRAFDKENKRLIGVAETHSEFEQLLTSALNNGGDSAAVQERMRVARNYSAENMARKRVRHIQNFLAHASAGKGR